MLGMCTEKFDTFRVHKYHLLYFPYFTLIRVKSWEKMFHLSIRIYKLHIHMSLIQRIFVLPD